jgi:tRNA pseudouridine55 synthase
MTYFGILNTNKPAGCTSRDVVNQVERLCRPAKAGHAGTLDPLATGVLVICVGQATRLIKYVQQMRKVYRATFLLARQSETDDSEGPVTVLDDSLQPTHAEIERALPQFVGTIQQRPPLYSAIKVAGQRAYKLARKGAAAELAPRAVTIHHLQVTSYEYPELQLDIECSSGTYVRALGRDLAAALGTTAIMSELVRTAIGSFRLDDAVPPHELTSQSLQQQLQSPLAAVADLPRVHLSLMELAEVRHGRPVDVSQPLSRTGILNSSQIEWAAVDAVGNLVAILRQKRPGQLWPTMNFDPSTRS